jgi:hypothetical protein
MRSTANGTNAGAARQSVLLEALARGEKAILEGRVLSHAEARKRLAKWFPQRDVDPR